MMTATFPYVRGRVRYGARRRLRERAPILVSGL